MNYKWTVLSVTTVGVLMSGIDGRIVVIGLPTVAKALHADAEQAIWFTQAYTFGSTISLLFLGRMSDIYGRVKVYTIGFVIFTFGSTLTSLSPDPYAFILSRIFQGVGSAALFANSAAILTDAFPSNELGRALGVNSVAFRTGSMLGLTLSGLILSILDWRFLFYVNIPVGIFGTLWARRRLREVGKRDEGAPMDWKGFLLFTSFITSFLLALTFAAYGVGERGTVAVLGVLAASFLLAFVAFERRTKYPLLDLRLMTVREYTGGVVTQLLNAMAWGAFVLVLSLYLQLVKGLTPIVAGLSIIPFDIAFLIFGPASGRLSDRFGTRPFTTAGIIVISLSMLLLSTIGPSTEYPTIATFLILGGAGLGLFVSPNISSIMGSVPPERRGVASALRATFFNIGLTTSFNIVILLLALTLPYSLVSGVISSAGSGSVSASDIAAFSSGLDRVFLFLSALNALALVPSLLRGKRVSVQPDVSSSSNSNTGAEGLPPID